MLWSLNGQFQLCEDDAEIVVQIAGGDLLWQKERLLNVALGYLPPECDKVAWVDCDVIFATTDWAARAEHALDTFRLIQPFRERCNLRCGGNNSFCHSISESVGYKIAAGKAHADDFRQSEAPLIRKSTAGLAWAARRELVEAHGLYDACILGSGDRAVLCAAMGLFDHGMAAVGMRGRQIEHYLSWATSFHRAIDGRVGFVDGSIRHLWHGDLINRKYAQRHEGLSRYEFDPFSDIALQSSGCWRWKGNKPEMQEYVKDYFASRKEDG
jgi:hypothetical protein